MKTLNLYLLASVEHDVLVPFLARLGEKALEQHLTLWIDTDDEILIGRLDSYLWTVHDASFIPHGREPDGWNRLVIAPLGNALPEQYTAVVHVLPQSPFVRPAAHALKIAEVHRGDDEDADFLVDRLRAYGSAGWEIQKFHITPSPVIPQRRRV